MTEEDKKFYQYRFQGFQFNMIQLDGTGPNYIQAQRHPYYYSPQPEYYTKPIYHGHPGGTSGTVSAVDGTLYPFLPVNENT